MKKRNIVFGAIIGFVLIVALFYMLFFSAPQKQAETERFIVSLNSTQNSILQKLYSDGFVKSAWASQLVLYSTKIDPGAYKIGKNMSVFKLAKVLGAEPYMKWVVIPEGLRKEQIGEMLTQTLGWTKQMKTDWITKDTAQSSYYIEGVYFPDTYLLSKEEDTMKIAERFVNKFNEKFQPYADKFVKENIKWDTAIKIASIVQREAAGKDDMPLIAGILWNRLLKNMRLEVDATIQYMRDDIAHYGVVRTTNQPKEYKNNGDWWKPIKPDDKKIESPYNTYKNAGLPPHPICNPGLEAIAAVLNPTKTECLFYLHDTNGQIHCSKTYEEHQKNIEKFL